MQRWASRHLALDRGLAEATLLAKTYVSAAISAGHPLGRHLRTRCQQRASNDSPAKSDHENHRRGQTQLRLEDKTSQSQAQHGSDNPWFGQGYGNAVATDGNGGTTCVGQPGTNGCPPDNTPGTTLPAGARSPTWNGATFEAHYIYSPQLIFIGRYELERVS